MDFVPAAASDHPILASIVLAIASNLDNLAVGTAYGVQKRRVGLLANLVVAIFSALSTGGAMWAALAFANFAGEGGTAALLERLGGLLLTLLGCAQLSHTLCWGSSKKSGSDGAGEAGNLSSPIGDIEELSMITELKVIDASPSNELIDNRYTDDRVHLARRREVRHQHRSDAADHGPLTSKEQSTSASPSSSVSAASSEHANNNFSSGRSNVSSSLPSSSSSTDPEYVNDKNKKKPRKTVNLLQKAGIVMMAEPPPKPPQSVASKAAAEHDLQELLQSRASVTTPSPPSSGATSPLLLEAGSAEPSPDVLPKGKPRSVGFQESLMLGLALTLANVGTGVAGGLARLDPLLTALLSALTSLVMLGLGCELALHAASRTFWLSTQLLSFLAGTILFIVGITKVIDPLN